MFFILLQVNQEENEEHEVDHMKKGADSTGKGTKLRRTNWKLVGNPGWQPKKVAN